MTMPRFMSGSVMGIGIAVLTLVIGSPVLAADDTKDKMIGPSMDTIERGKDMESRAPTSASKETETMTDELTKGKELQMKAPDMPGGEKPMRVPERSALGAVDHDFILFP